MVRKGRIIHLGNESHGHFVGEEMEHIDDGSPRKYPNENVKLWTGPGLGRFWGECWGNFAVLFAGGEGRE
jgi:hypothetical protein